MHLSTCKSTGVTLIELMIVIVIISILSAVAIPGYSEYVIRGRLAEATSSLADGRVRMEQFFQDNRTYVGGVCPTATKSFTFNCGNLSATTYTITAQGNASTPVSAFSYTINQANARTTTSMKSGWNGTALPANCWITTKGGAC